MAEMAFIGGSLATLAGAGLSAGGTIMGGNDAASGAYANQRYAAQMAPVTLLRGQYEQQQLNNQANEVLAASTRDAAMSARQRDYVMGAGRASAAANGGNATDTSVVNQLASVQQQGDYDKLMNLYNGQSKAAGLEYAGQNAMTDAQNQVLTNNYDASSAAYRGRLGQRNSILSAGGTILGAAGSLGTQYAGLKNYPSASTSSYWS